MGDKNFIKIKGELLMKKRTILITLMVALFTVVLGLNSIHAEENYRTVITDKIWWNNDSHGTKFEKFGITYIGDVARNSWGVFYFTVSGELAFYSPETGKTLDQVSFEGFFQLKLGKGPFEGGDHHFGRYIAGINYLKGYTSLDKIKAGMSKPKGTTPATPVNPADQYKPNDSTPAVPAKPANQYKPDDSTPTIPAEPKTPKEIFQPTSSTVAQPAPKQGWVQDKGNWFYYDQQGRQKSGWVQVGGAWYYLASDGKMQTGWVNQGGVWYYLNGSGAMQTGWLNQSGTWYYLNGSGAMQTGWLSLSGTWYYLTASGSMKTGWYQVGTKWYYSYGSGALAVSTTVDGYYVNANGEWV